MSSGRPNPRTKKWKIVRVDAEVYQAICDTRDMLEETSGVRVSLNDALKAMLSHRQPGGWRAWIK